MGKIILEEQIAADTPSTDTVALYPKAGGELYRKNDSGVEDQLLIESDVSSFINNIICHDGDVITHDGNIITG